MLIDVTKNVPNPGIPNIFSITKLPTSKFAELVPIEDISGNIAFLTACLKIITFLEIPFERAVLLLTL